MGESDGADVTEAETLAATDAKMSPTTGSPRLLDSFFSVFHTQRNVRQSIANGYGSLRYSGRYLTLATLSPVESLRFTRLHRRQEGSDLISEHAGEVQGNRQLATDNASEVQGGRQLHRQSRGTGRLVRQLRNQSTAVVSLDAEMQQRRFWLAALANGNVAIFDQAEIHGQLCERAKRRRRRAELRSSKLSSMLSIDNLPSVPGVCNEQASDAQEGSFTTPRLPFDLSPVFTCALEKEGAATAHLATTERPSPLRGHFMVQTNIVSRQASMLSHRRPSAPLLKCCRWVPGETGGLISTDTHNQLQVWDIEYTFSQAVAAGGLHQKRISSVLSVNLAPEGSSTSFFSFRQGYTSHALSELQANDSPHFSPVAERSVVACCAPYSIKLVDLRIGGVVTHLSTFPPHTGRRDTPTVVRWSSQNGAHLVSGMRSGSIHYWDIRRAGGTCLYSFSRDRLDPSFELQRNCTTERLAKLRGALRKRQRNLPVEAARTHQLLRRDRVAPLAPPVGDLQFVMAGRYVLSTSTQKAADTHQDIIQLWNASTGDFCPVYYGVPPTSQRNGTLSMSLSAQTLLPIKTEVFHVGQGKEFVCCGVNSTVAVYDIVSGSLVHSSIDHDGDTISSMLGQIPRDSGFYDPDLTPDGGVLVTGSTVGLVRAWGPERRTCET